MPTNDHPHATGPWQRVGSFKIDEEAHYLVRGPLRLSVKLGKYIEPDHEFAALIYVLRIDR